MTSIPPFVYSYTVESPGVSDSAGRKEVTVVRPLVILAYAALVPTLAVLLELVAPTAQPEECRAGLRLLRVLQTGAESSVAALWRLTEAKGQLVPRARDLGYREAGRIPTEPDGPAVYVQKAALGSGERAGEPDGRSGNSAPQVFQVGLKILDFEYKRPNRPKETVTVAVWYPTDKEPSRYVYRGVPPGVSRLALEAPLAARGRPYPLVLFAHGGFGSGFNSAFFMEYLASHGYIVVAPDYVDTAPPDYRRQVAFSRMSAQNRGASLSVLRILPQWLRDMSEDRSFMLSYLAEHRFRHTSFVLDEMVRQNRDPKTVFYRSIREEALGVCGHSEGGLTVLGKVGAHPDAQFRDGRIKAALVFSAPAYPFETTLENIDLPLMLMTGDDDTPALHPELPRRLIYNEAKPPKYYLVLKNADHFSFGNQVCGSLLLCEAVEKNPQANAICQYGLALFDRYLRASSAAQAQLATTDSAWAYYVKEERAGDTVEWGKEPPAGHSGPGGWRRRYGVGGAGRR